MIRLPGALAVTSGVYLSNHPLEAPCSISRSELCDSQFLSPILDLPDENPCDVHDVCLPRLSGIAAGGCFRTSLELISPIRKETTPLAGDILDAWIDRNYSIPDRFTVASSLQSCRNACREDLFGLRVDHITTSASVVAASILHSHPASSILSGLVIHLLSLPRPPGLHP